MLVRFGTDEPRHIGFTKDISLGGMQIYSKTAYKPNRQLKLLVQTPMQSIPATGYVTWTRNTSHVHRSMGIELFERPNNYIDFCTQMESKFVEMRHEQRFGKEFMAIFVRPEELLEKYIQDISQEGVFVLSEEAPQLNSTVDFQIIIADTLETILVTGIVVHIVTKEWTEQYGGNPGFGVKFVEFYSDHKKILDNYIDSLKVQFGEL